MTNLHFLTQDEIDQIGWEPSTPLLIQHPNAALYQKSPQTGYRLMNQGGDASTAPHLGLFAVVATVHDQDGNHFGKLIKFQSASGSVRTLYVPNRSQAMGGNKVLGELIDAGFPMEWDSEVTSTLLRYIRIRKIPNGGFVPYAKTIGYSKVFAGFVLPDGLYRREGKKAVVYENTAPDMPLHVRGSYDTWKQEIAKPAVQYHLPAFALMVAFAAMLFPFIDLGTIFAHFWSKSSRGKTMLLQLAASVFGNGSDPRNSSERSYICQWNATPSGLLGMAALYNSCIGLFDEIHKCEDADLDKAIYAMCGGVDKARAKSSGKLQEQQTWVFPGLSSGEESGYEKLKRTKKEETLGQMIRFLDIEVPPQMFTGLDDTAGETLANTLKGLCGRHYGHAARDFMQQLMALKDSHDELCQWISEEESALYTALCPPNLSTPEMRVMHHFALFALAGQLTVRFDILPMTEDAVIASISYVRDLWLAHMKVNAETLAKEAAESDYVALLKKAILRDAHLYPLNTDKTAKANVKGYIQIGHDKDPTTYLLKPETFAAIFKGHDLRQVKDYLVAQGVMLRGSDRFKINYRISSLIGKDGKSMSKGLYTIKAEILDDPEELKPVTCEVPPEDYAAFLKWQQEHSAPTTL